jgi:hypothetical protein
LVLVGVRERLELLAAIHRLTQHQLFALTAGQAVLQALLLVVLVVLWALVLVVQVVLAQPHLRLTTQAVVAVQVVILALVVLALSLLPEVTGLVVLAVVAQVAIKPQVAVVLGCWVLEQVVQALQIILLVAVEALEVKQVLG